MAYTGRGSPALSLRVNNRVNSANPETAKISFLDEMMRITFFSRKPRNDLLAARDRLLAAFKESTSVRAPSFIVDFLQGCYAHAHVAHVDIRKVTRDRGAFKVRTE